jgi:plasmid stability protein
MPRERLDPLPYEPDKPSDVQLQIRMPPALHARLRRRAFKESRSLAAVARELIAAGLKPKREPATP